MAIIFKISDEASTRGIVGQICIDICRNPSDNWAECQKNVRVKFIGNDGALLNSLPHFKIDEKRTCKPGCRYPGGSCISRNETRCGFAREKPQSTVSDSSLANVENGVKVGRCEPSHERLLSCLQPERDNNLVCKIKDEQKSSPKGEFVGSRTGQQLDGIVRPNSPTASREPETDASITRDLRRENQTILPSFVRPFLQERGPRCPTADGVKQETRREVNPDVIKTPGQQQRVPTANDRLLVEARRLCEDSGYWHGNDPFVTKKRSSLTLLKKASRVASTSDLHLPCHFPQVSTMNLLELTKRMNDMTKKRFNKVWNLTTSFKPEQRIVENPMLCPVKDAKMAVTNNLAVILPADTPITCHYFSVVEEKEPQHRRRPIHWARSFNTYCDTSGYEAKVDLKHHSNYFPRVMAEKGATFDLKAGFFQIELPSPSLFTFKDEEGTVYGLSRLPMGICTAPEIMQILTCTLSGEPTHCIPKYRSSAVVDVWIDNVLFTGSSDKVNDSVAQFKTNVEACKASINWKDSVEDSNELEFIGMKFNFKKNEISLTTKNTTRISNISFSEKMPFRELESATARLMYASSVLNVRLAKYYFALKFIRRRLSEINRDVHKRDTWVRIPPSTLQSYNDWLTDVKTSKPRKQQNISSRKSFTLWTDSSTIGWGAVLINEQTQEVKIVADKWTPSDKNLHINILEAKAVRLALGLLDEIDNSVCNLKIDNTSVVATVGKGYSKSEALNFEILQIQLLATRRNILIPKPSYVRSNDNIADHWSRIFDERHG